MSDDQTTSLVAFLIVGGFTIALIALFTVIAGTVVKAESIPLNVSVFSSNSSSIILFGEGFNITLLMLDNGSYMHNYSINRNLSIINNITSITYTNATIINNSGCPACTNNCPVLDYDKINCSSSRLDDIVSKRCQIIYDNFKAWSEITLLPQQKLLDDCKGDKSALSVDKENLVNQVRNFNQTLNLTASQVEPIKRENERLTWLVFILVGTILLIIIILIKGGHLGKSLPMWTK